jgi:hypothetical protein
MFAQRLNEATNNRANQEKRRGDREIKRQPPKAFSTVMKHVFTIAGRSLARDP